MTAARPYPDVNDVHAQGERALGRAPIMRLPGLRDNSPTCCRSTPSCRMRPRPDCPLLSHYHSVSRESTHPGET